MPSLLSLEKLRPWILVPLAVGCGTVGLDLKEDPTRPGATGGSDGEGGVGGSASGGLAGTGAADPGGGSGGVTTGGSWGFGGADPCDENCERVAEGLVLLYDFDEGTGSVARDTSGLAPLVDLAIPSDGKSTWVDSGLAITEETVLKSKTPAKKIGTAVQETNEISLEAWVQPADPLESGPARFFTLSNSVYTRNFLLGQDEERFVARLRTTETDEENGMPEVRSDAVVSKARTHVVFTHAANGDELLYIDGGIVRSGNRPGTFENWNLDYYLGVAGELDGEPRFWTGTIYLIAVYDRALTHREVWANAHAPF